jgi:two-component system, chemotaxis family, sensor kinase CheA
MEEFSLDDFIEDFLQEATEHLQSINSNLLSLERILTCQGKPEESVESYTSLISELFRSFHTLKGLSGMVGLRTAEELSHVMESVLRDIQKEKMEVNQEVIDRLFEGTKTLKTVVVGFVNHGQKTHDIQGMYDYISKLLDTPNTNPTTPQEGAIKSPPQEQFVQQPTQETETNGHEQDSTQTLEDTLNLYPEVKSLLEKEDYDNLYSAIESGKFAYLVVFSPSTDKAEHGKNVSQLREQMSEGGVLLKSIPLIKKDNVRFAFLVSRSKPLPVEVFQDAEVTPLKEDGIRILKSDSETPEAIPAPEQPLAPTTHPVTTSLRIDLDKLDEVMRLVSELVVVKSRIDDQVTKLASSKDDGKENSIEILEQSVSQLDKNLRDMRAAVTRARMVPLSEVFNHMPLVVRDLTRAQNKEVRLVLEGEHTQIDKVMIERLLDPLVHLVRNAVTHGIENRAERTAAGKPAFGSLILRGTWEGDQILIELADDGRGIDADQIKEKAVQLGFLEPGQTVDETNLIELLAKPGFSTLDEAHLGAGRGIGMEVVLRNIRAVGGSIELDTKPGIGSVFRLLMPLTLTILDAIIARVGSERYAIPRHTVEEVIEIDPAEVIKVESGEIIPFRSQPLVLIRLSDLFHLPHAERDSANMG